LPGRQARFGLGSARKSHPRLSLQYLHPADPFFNGVQGVYCVDQDHDRLKFLWWPVGL
jgi:hypothetical protein